LGCPVSVALQQVQRLEVFENLRLVVVGVRLALEQLVHPCMGTEHLGSDIFGLIHRTGTREQVLHVVGRESDLIGH
jgi:hypothetical protein